MDYRTLGPPRDDIRLHTEADVLAQGYIKAKPLAGGAWLAVQPMIYTGGLFIVTDTYSWRTRWCYQTVFEALFALDEWDGVGAPPGRWIVQKPEGLMGPGATSTEHSD